MIFATKLHSKYQLFLALVFIFVSCGRMGDSDNKDGGTDEDDTNRRGVVSATQSKVVGKFTIMNNVLDMETLQLWILNHTESTILTVPIDSEGNFSIAISKFVDGSVYTSHLVTQDFREIGMIDTSTHLDGVQSSFKYEGGIGFDFGEMTVELDREGKIGVDSAILGRMGGGFSTQVGSNLSLNDFKFPSYIESAVVSSSLIINKASILLNSFYLREKNSSAFARDLEKHTGIYSKIVANEVGIVDRVSVFKTGRWLETSRIAQDFNAGFESSTLWSLNTYTYNKESDSIHSASVYSGKIVSADTILFLSIVPTDGRPQFFGPRAVRSAFTMPPQLTAISMNANDPVAIDYLDTEAENGLNRPFCLGSQDIKLDILAPQDQNGNFVPHSRLDTVRIKFHYYTETDGLLEAVDVLSSDLSSTYTQDVIDSSLQDITRYWGVESKELRFVLGELAGATNKKSISVPIELFLTNSNGKQIKHFKLEVFFEDSSYDDTSGSIIWFDSEC